MIPNGRGQMLSEFFSRILQPPSWRAIQSALYGRCR